MEWSTKDLTYAFIAWCELYKVGVNVALPRWFLLKGTVIIPDSKISGKSSKISKCIQQPPSFSHAFFHILSFLVSDNAVMASISGAIRELYSFFRGEYEHTSNLCRFNMIPCSTILYPPWSRHEYNEAYPNNMSQAKTRPIHMVTTFLLTWTF